VDEQLSKKVVISALKKSSKKQKRKGLAHAISESQKRIYTQSDTDQVTSLERAFTGSGMNELGEIVENSSSVPPSTPVPEANIQGTIHSQNAQIPAPNNAATRGRGGSRGRGRRTFVRQTGESDPYDMSIAPLNIYENQVIPVGLHNLSKSFRPNLSTIRVLSLGTKFIPKWKFEKRNNTFVFFKDFLRRMQNKIYFTEVKPGIYKRDSKFKLKNQFCHI